MTKIKTTPEQLKDYFYGTCTAAEAYAVESWLGTEDISDEEAAWMEDIFNGIEVHDDAAADRAYRRCLGFIWNRNCQESRLESVWKWIAGVAASVAVVAAVAGLWNRADAGKQPETTFKEVYAGRGQSETIILPDGSEIILKSGSRLIYPDAFRGTAREVFLSGECYASISKNPDMPFVLSTGSMDIRVTGTEFNVKSYPEDSEAEVALVEGSILVDSKPANGTASRTIAISPGNLVKVDRKSGETRINGFDTTRYTESVDKHNGFIFLDQRFCDIVSELNRRLDVSIVLMDAELGQRRFYSSFINGESIDQILASFNADGFMKITRDGSSIIIQKGRI